MVRPSCNGVNGFESIIPEIQFFLPIRMRSGHIALPYVDQANLAQDSFTAEASPERTLVDSCGYIPVFLMRYEDN